MKVPRLGVKLELQLLACAQAIATPDPSYVSVTYTTTWQQLQILNPLSGARDWILIFKDTSWACFWWATTGGPILPFFFGRLAAYGVPGQGSDQSHSYDLSCCSWILNSLCWAGDRTSSQRSKNAVNPVAPQKELPYFAFWWKNAYLHLCACIFRFLIIYFT